MTKGVKLLGSLALGVWFAGAVVMTGIYEYEQQIDCVKNEGWIKGLFWCSTDSISPYARGVSHFGMFIKGLKWPLHLVSRVSEDKEKPVRSRMLTKEGFFSIDPSGWLHSTTPHGDDVFTCSACKDKIQVHINYGSPLGTDSPFKTNEQFLTSLRSDAAQKRFSELMLRKIIGQNPDFKISIKSFGFTKIGEIDTFSVILLSEIPTGELIRNATFFSVHKNRSLKIMIYSVGAEMGQETRTALTSLLEGLKFFRD